LTILEIVLVTIIISIAATLQGSIGFGMALAANPLLVLIDTAYVPGPMLASAFVLSIMMLIRERDSISLEGLQWAIVGRVFGAIISAGLLLLLDPEWFIILFSFLILFAVLITASGYRISLTKTNLAISGLLAGIMGTIASIGGPPMALVYQRENGSRIRTTLSGFFIAGTIISMITLAIIGKFGMNEIRLTVRLLPGILLGFLLSNKSMKWFEGKYTRTLILVVASVSAVLLIIRQII